MHCLNTYRCLSFNKLLKKWRGRLGKNDKLLWVCFYLFLCNSNSYYINNLKGDVNTNFAGSIEFPFYLTSQWCASPGNMDQFSLLGNCPSTPPLSEHYFSLRAKICWLRGGVARWTFLCTVVTLSALVIHE